MPFECGIIGLPNAGKSTLFSALTSQQVEVGSYPFTTIEPNKGIVPVPDKRLEQAALVAGCKKITPANLTFVDIAGLVEGASRGEGLGNQFLAHIREMDILLHLVRCFEKPEVARVGKDEDPVSQAEIVELELAMADLASLEKRREKIERRLKAGDPKIKEEYHLLQKVMDFLSQGILLKDAPLSEKEKKSIAGWQLLTSKPVLYVLNIDEAYLPEQEAREEIKSFKTWSRKKNAPCLLLSASLEAELARLEDEEKAVFLEEYGLKEPALHSLIRTGKSLLKLLSFFTVKGEEARAWAVPQGTTAREAAGKVHSDMAKNFIVAEVIFWEDLVNAGSLASAREKGLLRQEGRDYLVQDGEVIRFRFH